ncbi:ABC transporter [Mycobacterium intermedium]|uniref:ABC transporter n=1 Tax=Mycobacterium intermedium TaxID=28445 RepID=A0A1E3S857_MYCIE|nr:DUF302 domain-containing protein [Mycobacterium intermedium]MCV6967778.1 DUF302 domain-containing protein [Mycobacterium intermedium]ODQ98348.1 ABC transporter [Mycobacterium intermedium]OPE45611.1 ABC transporter [Mycobacterium intermedium]ORB06551.1 ABC transporter [Mycobacterium intermedium]
MTTGLSVELNTSFENAVERTTKALADQGFGVLTTIDIKATMKQKLDEDMENYVILGACNPVLAHRALGVDRQLGQLLPCNVVVRSDRDNPDGVVLVEAMDPQIMVRVAGDSEGLREVADQAAAKLQAAISAVGQTGSG